MPEIFRSDFHRFPPESAGLFTGVPCGGPQRYNRVAVLRFWLLILVAAAAPSQVLYEVSGRIRPEGHASVTLFGVIQPFTTSTFTDQSGRFTFKKLPAASYTLAVFQPGRGEARQTIEVGPSLADARHRIILTVNLKDADFDPDAERRRHSVSVPELKIPGSALRDYLDAHRDLEKRDVEAAEKHLEHAVEVAPRFANAWNTLGTIAYQTRRFPLAEERFRQALKQDPTAYEPLVNLGGVLVTLHRLDEALEVNVHATLTRPGDALANSQLGMTYFELGQFDSAVKYLERARQIDPGHFSHPQLFLAEIHLRRGQKREAASVLEDFLQHHPDYPQAEVMRRNIVELRQ
jgi:Tfp pilus assembly protein PilF